MRPLGSGMRFGVAESNELELRYFPKARTTWFTTSELEQTRETMPFSKRERSRLIPTLTGVLDFF